MSLVLTLFDLIICHNSGISGSEKILTLSKVLGNSPVLVEYMFYSVLQKFSVHFFLSCMVHVCQNSGIIDSVNSKSLGFVIIIVY